MGTPTFQTTGGCRDVREQKMAMWEMPSVVLRPRGSDAHGDPGLRDAAGPTTRVTMSYLSTAISSGYADSPHQTGGPVSNWDGETLGVPFHSLGVPFHSFHSLGVPFHSFVFPKCFLPFVSFS